MHNCVTWKYVLSFKLNSTLVWPSNQPGLHINCIKCIDRDMFKAMWLTLHFEEMKCIIPPCFLCVCVCVCVCRGSYWKSEWERPTVHPLSIDLHRAARGNQCYWWAPEVSHSSFVTHTQYVDGECVWARPASPRLRPLLVFTHTHTHKHTHTNTHTHPMDYFSRHDESMACQKLTFSNLTTPHNHIHTHTHTHKHTHTHTHTHTHIYRPPSRSFWFSLFFLCCFFLFFTDSLSFITLISVPFSFPLFLLLHLSLSLSFSLSISFSLTLFSSLGCYWHFTANLLFYTNF